MTSILLCLALSCTMAASAEGTDQADTVETSAERTTHLYVSTTPRGAQVTVDGKQLGTSPGVFDVESGNHQLTIELEGHQSKREKITIRGGRVTRITLTLEPIAAANRQESVPRAGLFSFSSVTEQDITFPIGREARLIDLDTHRVTTIEKFDPTDAGTIAKVLGDGADLLIFNNKDKQRVIGAIELTLDQAPGFRWDSISPGEVVKQLKWHEKRGSPFNLAPQTTTDTSWFTRIVPQGSPPFCLLFSTRGGNTGVVRIDATGDEPPHGNPPSKIKLRSKLVLSRAARARVCRTPEDLARLFFESFKNRDIELVRTSGVFTPDDAKRMVKRLAELEAFHPEKRSYRGARRQFEHWRHDKIFRGWEQVLKKTAGLDWSKAKYVRAQYWIDDDIPEFPAGDIDLIFSIDDRYYKIRIDDSFRTERGWLSTDDPLWKGEVSADGKEQKAAPVAVSRRKPASPHRRPRYFVRLVVGENRMTFEGEETSWEALPALLKKVPNRAQTVLELAIPSRALIEKRRNRELRRAAQLVQRLGLEYVSAIGVHPLGSKGSPAQLDNTELDLLLSPTKSKSVKVTLGQSAEEVLRACEPAQVYADDDPWLGYPAFGGGHYVLMFATEGTTKAMAGRLDARCGRLYAVVRYPTKSMDNGRFVLPKAWRARTCGDHITLKVAVGSDSVKVSTVVLGMSTQDVMSLFQPAPDQWDDDQGILFDSADRNGKFLLVFSAAEGGGEDGRKPNRLSEVMYWPGGQEETHVLLPRKKRGEIVPAKYRTLLQKGEKGDTRPDSGRANR